MDLPWNPAILEQRIARIHRMGQKQPVQIVNFVSKGTIEEGMLSVLAFKRSLSAGILDGGIGEISLGGSRLNRFMKDVENVTGHMGEGEAVSPSEETGSVSSATGDEPVEAINTEENINTEEKADSGAKAQEAEGTTFGQSNSDPWGALLQFGSQLVTALTATSDGESVSHPWIERDPATGTRSLKVPLPPPETAKRLADALSVLADTLRGR
jgi:hypothetical protein